MLSEPQPNKFIAEVKLTGRDPLVILEELQKVIFVDLPSSLVEGKPARRTPEDIAPKKDAEAILSDLKQIFPKAIIQAANCQEAEFRDAAEKLFLNLGREISKFTTEYSKEKAANSKGKAELSAVEKLEKPSASDLIAATGQEVKKQFAEYIQATQTRLNEIRSEFEAKKQTMAELGLETSKDENSPDYIAMTKLVKKLNSASDLLEGVVSVFKTFRSALESLSAIERAAGRE